jgi:hypothetical protein
VSGDNSRQRTLVMLQSKMKLTQSREDAEK